MVGKNVVFKAGATEAPPKPKLSQEEGSNSTLTSYEVIAHAMDCVMSVSPVVSAPEAVDSFMSPEYAQKAEETAHHKNKRRKGHHGEFADRHFSGKEGHNSNSRRPFHHLVTHYVIELHQVQDSDRHEESISSHLSSVEARLQGLSKEELQRQQRSSMVAPPAAHESEPLLADVEEGRHDDDEASETESAQAKEPVTAIG